VVILGRTDILHRLRKMGMGQAIKSFLWAGGHSLVGAGQQPHQCSRCFSILFPGNTSQNTGYLSSSFGIMYHPKLYNNSPDNDLQWLLIPEAGMLPNLSKIDYS